MNRNTSALLSVSWLAALSTLVAPYSAAIDIPIVSTRSGSASVFFLDFRGQGPITIPGWNNGLTANPVAADLNNLEIRKIVDRVAEYYAPFDVNVTTDHAQYDPPAGTVGHRMRCIIALKEVDGVKVPLPDGIGGSALRGSFLGSSLTYPSSGGYHKDIVCWVSCQPNFPKDAEHESTLIERVGDTIAHELGHTLGLPHWGTLAYDSYPISEYYPNDAQGQVHGASRWGPLMGQFNGNGVRQWSKGEFSRAARVENGIIINGIAGDLNIISSALVSVANPTGYLPDDKGNDRPSSALLVLAGKAPSDGGVISSETDEDFFRFTTVSSGKVSLEVNPRFVNHALDIFAELQNLAGTTVASDNDITSRGKKLTVSELPAGTYYLRVRGNEQGLPATDGWSRYGSIGTYRITGTIASGTISNPPQFLAATDAVAGSVGVTYSYNLQATNSPTSFYATSGVLPPGLLLGPGGVVSGTPTLAGSYTLNLTAENSEGATSKTFSFKIYGATSLPEALDSVQQDWITYSPPVSPPDSLWQGQRIITYDGSDAARSGAIGSNAESVLTTDLKGPGKLTFYWRTSSHSSDRLIFKQSSTEQFNIGGETAWEQKTLLITGSGTYPVSWIYRTDGGTTAGQNAGFVDRVAYLRYPDFADGNFYAGGRIGRAFSREIPLDGAIAPTTWALTGGSLPPGIGLDPTTGRLSGVPNTIGTYSPEITATNSAGSSTTYPNLYIYPDISVPTGLDAEGLVWSTDSANPWFGDTAPNHDGLDAAHSGPIRHGLSSWMQTTVTGPGTFSFWWKASTEASGDPGYFSIDGAVQATISGESSWAQQTYNLSSGSHTLRWNYLRDNGGNGGSNMVWVDQVSWITPGPTITNALTANWTVGGTYTISLTSDDPSATWSITGALPSDMFLVPAPSNVLGAVPKLPRVVTFTLNATNASGTTTSRMFTANIESAYTAWARTKGLAVGTPLGDPDKDGIVNLAECAFGLEPNVRNNGFQPVSFDTATKRLRAVFNRRHQYFSDLKYEVQVSSDLVNWTSIATVDNGASFTNSGSQSITETQVSPFPDPIYQATVVDGTAQSTTVQKRHMRVKITQM